MSKPTGRRTRRRFLAATGAVGIGTLAGCTGDNGGETATPTDPDSGPTPTGEATPTQPTIQKGGTLTVGLGSSVNSLDPHRARNAGTMTILYHIYDTLVTRDRQTGELVGNLASDWTVEERGSLVTFELREGVQFHPPVSRELVADDVVYSYDRMTREGTTIRGDLGPVEEVSATDEYTVEVSLAQPFIPHLTNQIRPRTAIVPQEVQENADEIGEIQNPVGTGPFVFEELAPDSHVSLSAFDDYYEEDLPYLDALQIQFVPDRNSRVLAVRNGDVDFGRSLPLENAESIANNSQTKTLTRQSMDIGRFYVNCAAGPFGTPDVRRAVAHLVNREAIIEAATYGHATPAFSPFPPGSKWHSELSNKREYDAERANELLSAAGNPFDDYTPTIKYASNEPVNATTATVLQATLDEQGIDAETEGVDSSTIVRDWIGGNYDLLLSAISNPDPFLDYAPFVTESFQLNLTNYDSSQPGHDDMVTALGQSAATPDDTARKDLFTTVAELVQEHAPMIPFAYIDMVHGLQQSVMGNEPDAQHSPILRYSDWSDNWLNK